MKKLITSVFFTLFCLARVYSQEYTIAKLGDGTKIKLLDNYTWFYESKILDSASIVVSETILNYDYVKVFVKPNHTWVYSIMYSKDSIARLEYLRKDSLVKIYKLISDSISKRINEISSDGAQSKGKHWVDLQNTDCNKFIKEYNDIVTGDKYFYSTNYITLTNKANTGKIRIYMNSYSKNQISLMFKVFGGGNCIDKDASIYILFKDGTRLHLNSDVKFNCDQNAAYNFLNYDEYQEKLLLLRVKPVSIIRIYTYKSNVEVTLTAEQQRAFIQTIYCLYKAWD